MIKVIFRAGVPFAISIAVQRTLVAPPPIEWSIIWSLPLLIILAAGVVVDEIAAARRSAS